MPASDIVGSAREHNLRSVDVSPRNKLICLTGVSGSGKSSLAFDTLYAEGQRRYVESLSSSCAAVSGTDAEAGRRAHLGLESVDLDLTEDSGAEPAIDGRNDHGDLRLLAGALRAWGRGIVPSAGERSRLSRARRSSSGSMKSGGYEVPGAAPLIRGQKGEYRDLFDDLLKQGFSRSTGRRGGSAVGWMI